MWDGLFFMDDVVYAYPWMLSFDLLSIQRELEWEFIQVSIALILFYSIQIIETNKKKKEFLISDISARDASSRVLSQKSTCQLLVI